MQTIGGREPLHGELGELLRRDREPAQDPRRAADPRAATRSAPYLEASASARSRCSTRSTSAPTTTTRCFATASSTRCCSPTSTSTTRRCCSCCRWSTNYEPVDGRSRPAAELVARRAGDGRGRRPASYEIGAPERGFAYDNERPRHSVELDAFEIDRTPVTNGAYIEFMERHRRRAADVLGARRRGRLGPQRRWAASTPSIPPCRSSTSPGTRPTPSPAGPASGCLPRRSGRRRRWAPTANAPTSTCSPSAAPPPAPTPTPPPTAARSRCSATSGSGRRATSLAYAGLRGVPLPRVLGGLLRRHLQGAARRRLGDPPQRDPQLAFRNWDLPERRQIFAGLRCARDVHP